MSQAVDKLVAVRVSFATNNFSDAIPIFTDNF
jgi:hypothetical protein